MSEGKRVRIDRETRVHEILQEYLLYESRVSDPPFVKVALVSQTPPNSADVSPSDIAAATAIQCSSKQKIPIRVRASDSGADGYQHALDVNANTLGAAHLTTRMHFYVTFFLDRVSRDVVHDFLHNYPFYNSEQQSQRYVEVIEGSYIQPLNLTPEQQKIYYEAAAYANRAYFELKELLLQPVDERLSLMYHPNTRKSARKGTDIDKKIEKLAQENARYVLPIGQVTRMYHTINHEQLLRLFHASRQPNVTDEGRYIVARMIVELLKEYPDFIKDLQIPAEPMDDLFPVQEEVDYLVDDRKFTDYTKYGVELLGNTPNPRQHLAQAIRMHFPGATGLDDATVLNRVLNPQHNVLLANLHRIGMHDPLNQALRQIWFTSRFWLSHSANSQRQRHRRLSSFVTPIVQTYQGFENYVIPRIILETPHVHARYLEIMKQRYNHLNQALEASIPPETAFLLAPNAHRLIVDETGDLFDLIHFSQQRNCLLAQQEVSDLSIWRALEMIKIIPELEIVLGAPCLVNRYAGDPIFCHEKLPCGPAIWKYTNIALYPELRKV